jgi:hypothetical protein
MVEINQFNNQQSFANQNQANQAFNQQNQTFQNPQNQVLQPKGLFQIPEKYLQLIPLLPFALEMLTGQKVPPVGVMADILSLVQQNQVNLNRVIDNQQQL